MNIIVLLPEGEVLEKLLFVALKRCKRRLFALLDHEPANLNQLNEYISKIYEIAYRFNEDLDVNVVFRDPHVPDCTLIRYSSSDSKLNYPTIVVPDSELDHVKLQISTKPAISSTVNASYQQYKVSAVGGTFDHLHSGHKMLLTASVFVTARLLIIGVTGPELLKNKKFAEYLESYETRVKKVKAFIELINPELQVEFHQINDICGPTASVKDIDALVLSSESVKGGEYINKVRVEKGFPELEVVQIATIGGDEAGGFQNKLSSTQIRKKEYLGHQVSHD
ncbi:hypothetical protein KL930_001469 [Ogataea haglerorum]|uniref:Cytidyltransferase-like domain-containing protein n=1 Tax=Ogataea haglerorum TaxID=1937702 RepID=A0AAN6HYM8_9ASCO|nr:hypothetical protein KL915_005339 [Ogataea haglerorum]KAG7698691.1 hypothetical protein KL951_001955 [Ogataea haglerorum]KAG7703579.1 hypothetical protein KL914_004536 [Ogataea haglerorum]KAG7704175.1 hypothetical protein KL950_004502 [Ogataea haglerorum]KAG7712971.1 hypothetical protein KL949_005353 [Ogataea haglerorum]